MASHPLRMVAPAVIAGNGYRVSPGPIRDVGGFAKRERSELRFEPIAKRADTFDRNLDSAAGLHRPDAN
jgi:hypothetical protein